MLFEIYHSQPPPRSCLALQCIVFAASVRRSIFQVTDKHKEYMSSLLQNTIDIMQREVGLNDQDNFHEFCRLLSRVGGAVGPVH